ncbi:MAG TPA: amidase [Stellaceae bacterium]|nr:amidase [Stellaceae bacterium]
MTEDLAYLSAAELAARYRAGSLTPAAATETALTRLARLEPCLNAFQRVEADAAREAAERSTERWSRGAPLSPLDGVPVTVKDTLLAKGWPTLHGSRTVDPAQSWREDSPQVARLREAGAVLLGKTTTPEFGWKALTDSPLKGATCNPWNPEMTPGGSSGGAAAALAAGIGALALGTDGGGSIRIPASHCGLFGFKPSWGRVPHYPHKSPFSTTISSGPLARSVLDAALMLNELAKPDARDVTALPYEPRDWSQALAGGTKGLRIAFAPGLGGAEPRDAVLRPVAEAVRLLGELGAAVAEAGSVIEPLQPVFEPYWLASFAHTLRQIPRDRHELLDPRFRLLAEQGLSVGLEAYCAGAMARLHLAERLQAFYADYDLLVTPVLPTPPPPVTTPYHSAGYDRWRDAVPYTLPFNLAGNPAASLPCGVTEDGLPVGVQIAGPRFADALVLRASRALEEALGWPQPHPLLQASLERLAA